MTLAREVNILLDEILEVREKAKNSPSNNDSPVDTHAEYINTLEKELNKITNDGQNCKDLFTNIYYVNNFLMDKEINKTKIPTEEEIAQDLIKGLSN